MSADFSARRSRQPDGALLASANDPAVDSFHNDSHHCAADSYLRAVSYPTAAQVFVEDRAVDEVLEF